MFESWNLSLLEFFIRSQPPRLRVVMHTKRLMRRMALKFKFLNGFLIQNVPQPAEKYRRFLIEDRKLAPNFRWFSQSGQDIFALASLTNSKTVGSYLEIGSYLPFKNSNTALLENLGWFGVSIEKQNEFVRVFNSERNNKAICADALTLDYSLICRPFEMHFDYCSIDIDPAVQSYFVLKRIIESGVTFDSLTFEHDKYRDGAAIQIASVLLLRQIGMVRVEKDVKAAGFGSYEDWWIRPSLSS